MHRLVEDCPTVNTRIPLILLNQPTLRTDLSIHRHPREIRINENTLAPIINFKYSLTGRADCRSRIVHDVRLSAEGADHSFLNTLVL